MSRRLAMALILALTPLSLWGKGRSVDFKGISLKKQAELRLEVPALFSKGFTQSDLDQALQNLYRSGLYETLNAQVVADDDGTDTTLIVGTSIRKIKSVTIHGNSRVSESDIRDILAIEDDDRFDRNDLAARGEKVRDMYGERGFLNTGIEIDFKEPKDGEIHVTYTIKEGTLCQISEIRFATNNEELQAGLKKEVKKFLKLSLNEESLSKVQAALNAYFVENRFLSSQLTGPDIKYNENRSQAIVTYSIDRPFRFVILMSGNEVIGSSEIIRNLELEKPNTLGSAPSSEITARIEKLYQKRGYANVAVNLNEKVYTQNFVRQLNYSIDEGPKVKMRELEITGTVSRPGNYYVDFIQNHSTPLISHMLYNKEDLDVGLKNLAVELQNQGYLKARVVSSRVEFEKNRQFVHVSIQVEEGPLTRIQTLAFNGAKAFDKETLSLVLGLRTGDALKLNELEAGLEKLKDYYHSQGFLDMTINNERDGLVHYSSENTLADLTFEIAEGPKVTVGSIVVDGNSFTKEYVILKELEFEVGDVLTPQRIKDSEYRLQRLGLFGVVEIRTLEVGTSISERTVIVKVSERDPGIFNFGFGANTEFQFTVRGYTGFAYRNLRGTARGVSARLELKKITDIDFIDQKITFGYLEPYVFGTRTRGRENLTRMNGIVDRYSGPAVKARDSTLFELNLEREFS